MLSYLVTTGVMPGLKDTDEKDRINRALVSSPAHRANGKRFTSNRLVELKLGRVKVGPRATKFLTSKPN
ncbi:hypothetical protein PspLS_00727 [Pyricularia sp. CBS 133598]|nr:hypothetical protein PspLS_00727 [Pyricularia sp. CBS 133598]